MAAQVVTRLSIPPSLRRSDIYFLLNPLPADFLLYAMAKTDSETVEKTISLYFTELKRIKVSLSGQDLRRMGFVPGPIYTEILQTLLRAKLEGKLVNRQEEIDFVSKKYRPRQGDAERRKLSLPKKKRGGEPTEKTSSG
jgi:tRNA nucleotidyltransferase (CCA-adding enzyme)